MSQQVPVQHVRANGITVQVAVAGVESLRCGFESCRAIPTSAGQVRAAPPTRRPAALLDQLTPFLTP